MKRDWLPLPRPELMLRVCGVERFADVVAAAFESAGREALDQLKALGLLRDGDRVLELGCGCGRLARMLVDEPIARYVGYDADPAMLEWCATEITPRDDRFEFRPVDRLFADGGGLPDEPGAFDLTVSETMFDRTPLEHVGPYLRELARVLAPGGRLVIAVYFAVGRTYADALHTYYEPKRFWELVEAAGFEHRLVSDPVTGKHRNWCVLTLAAA
jgi:SAM-dependent methyltransferase